MKENIQNPESDEIQETEVNAEKIKSVIKPSIKKSLSPIFQGNHFNKWIQGNNINNRQRPWRAANRGR